MGTKQSSASPAHHHDDTIEAHYASLERGIPCGCYYCFGGYVTITVEEDGREFEEAVSCRRCSEQTH